MLTAKKLLKQLNKAWDKFRTWYNTKTIDRLLNESGIDVSPDPEVWGILNKTEEDIVLANLYENKLWVALMRKYAEGANKAMIEAVRLEHHAQALRQNALFYSYNNQIIKARRAARRLKDENDNNQI